MENGSTTTLLRGGDLTGREIKIDTAVANGQAEERGNSETTS